MKKKYKVVNNLIILKNAEKDIIDKDTIDGNSQEELFEEFLDILYRCLLKNDKIKTESEYLSFMFTNQREIKSLLGKIGFNQRF